MKHTARTYVVSLDEAMGVRNQVTDFLDGWYLSDLSDGNANSIWYQITRILVADKTKFLSDYLICLFLSLNQRK